MRYEHIEWNLSTRTCDMLRDMIEGDMRTPNEPELMNCANELRSRLQHRDADPHCPKNQVSTEKEWLDL